MNSVRCNGDCLSSLVPQGPGYENVSLKQPVLRTVEISNKDRGSQWQYICEAVVWGLFFSHIGGVSRSAAFLLQSDKNISTDTTELWWHRHGFRLEYVNLLRCSTPVFVWRPRINATSNVVKVPYQSKKCVCARGKNSRQQRKVVWKPPVLVTGVLGSMSRQGIADCTRQ